MPSPPKPWEVNNGTAAASTPVVSQSMNDASSAITSTPSATTTTVPTVPSRPSTLGTSNYGGYGTSGYGTSGYGTSSYGGYGSTGYGGYGTTGYGGYGTTGYGGYGTSGYGGYGSTGYGSYNSPYSRLGMGYGSSYSPYNRFGGNAYGNRFGMGGGPDEFGLTQRMETSTRATFDVIESIVSAFGGFAQMLDSTYMATHSSFMAMVGVAEQFGNLRHYLGGIFSIYALLRWMKRMLYRLTGRTPPPELSSPETESDPQQGGEQQQQLQITENGEQEETEVDAAATLNQLVAQRPSRSKRPIIIFLALVTGLPYLMYKLIQKSKEYRLRQRMMIPQFSGPPPQLARVVHDFVAASPIELTIRQGELIHVLSTVDPATGMMSDWWQGRNENGAVGVFPANFVQIEKNSIY
ncbi:MAG: Peroxin 13, N-terminal region-domain-containing protein [Benjaminiella poitrasii]|nr:MAG: Peroxin 13, N-terminal region-domain-containing protein [Benjaminiella poitrasii]